MPYVTEKHLEAALDELFRDGHPVHLIVASMLRHGVPVGPDGEHRPHTDGQVGDLMQALGFHRTDSERPFFAAMGPSSGTRAEFGRWREPNYCGRSLQAQRKKLEDRGILEAVGTGQGRTYRFGATADAQLAALLERRSAAAPLSLAPLAVWWCRATEIDSVAQAVQELQAAWMLAPQPLASVFSAQVSDELAELELGEQPLDGEATAALLARLGGEQVTAPTGRNPVGKRELDWPLQYLVHGCPGSGKSYAVQQKARDAHFVIRTTFHPATRYADFVGTLRPQPAYRTDATGRYDGPEGELPGEPFIVYAFAAGPLVGAYLTALRHPKDSVVLVIEELSRAEAALAFGDVLQLLDRLDADDGSIGAGHSRYAIEPEPALRALLAASGLGHPADPPGSMRLPPNLYIWATMNRADQNARQLDSAFLRRWRKKRLSYSLPNDAYGSTPVAYGGGTTTWDLLRGAINARLEALGISEDKFVGPYLVGADVLSDPEHLFEDLFAYLWLDVLKSRAPSFFDTQPATLSVLQAQYLGNERILGALAAPGA